MTENRFFPGVCGMLFAALMAVTQVGRAAPDGGQLYRELGETEGLEKITSALLVRVHSDPRTQTYFDGVSDKRLKQKLVEQFCVIADGPCTYTGRTMERSHAGLHVTQAAFNALVEDLQAAMSENHVPYRTQNRFLARLAPLISQVKDK